jgi:Ca-activated chloride channel family protein
MEFQYPWMFLSLACLPLVLLAWLLAMRWKKRAMERYGDAGVIIKIIPDYSGPRQAVKFALFFIALAMILTGATNPRFGAKLEKVRKKGADIVICLDISNSMRARDIKPDRLERSKMAISKLIDRLDNDQIGLVVFAGRAQTQLPVTPDYAGAKLYLNAISNDIIAVQGTAIGAAIDLASGSFNFKSKTKKIIILLSDGENHEDDALAAAEKAAQKGVCIYTVGFGSPEGAPIPVATGNALEYKKDENGNTVISKLNETMLRQIAATGKGTYARATSADPGLNRIYDEISKMEKAEYEALSFTDYENLYPYFLGAGLLLLIAEFLIFERKTRLTRNIKIFSKPVSEYVAGEKSK